MMRPITVQPATALSLNCDMATVTYGSACRGGDIGEHGRDGKTRDQTARRTRKRATRGRSSKPVHADDGPPADRQHGHMRDERGNGGAVDAETEPIDQDRIEDGGNDRPGQRHVHGAARISGRAQNGGRAHGERQRRQRRQHDAKIVAGERQRAPARAQPAQQQRQRRPQQRNHQCHGAAREYRRVRGQPARPRNVARSERGRHQRRHGNRHADARRDHEEQ